MKNKNLKKEATKKTQTESTLDLENKIRNIRSRVNYKLVVLGLFTIILMIALIVVLNKVTSLKSQLTTGVYENSVDSLDVDVLTAQLAANKTKIDKINGFIASETEIVDFVQYLDNLKNSGTISDFSFSSNEKIKDKTASSGYLLKININGNSSQVENALNSISNLPFLIRGINFEMVRVEEGQFQAVYEVIMYTNE